MKIKENNRRSSFVLVSAVSALLLSSISIAADLDEPEGITSRAAQSCPLNSGGPSLMGTKWRVSKTYNNAVPEGLDMVMNVSLDTMAGDTTCNKYAAKFRQVGNTGFTITDVTRSKNPCKLLRPKVGGKTIHVGNIEGAYLRIIKRMGSVQQMDNGTLVFFDRNGKEGLEMTKL